MSSSEKEAASPVLGARSSKDPPPQLNSVASDDDDELPDQPRLKSHSRPRIQWQEVLRFEKGARAIMGEDQMKLEIAQAYNKIMDESRMVRLPGHVPAPTDCGLWKLKRETMIDYGTTSVKWMTCPMAYRFGCNCQIKISDGTSYCSLQVRGEHNADSHAPDKDKSKHLKVAQLRALQEGVRLAPSQPPRTFRRNMANLGPEVEIDPSLIRHVRRRVAKVRAQLTLEQLE